MKWQARQHGVSSAAASKSFNHKNMEKYLQRRDAKLEREQQKINQEIIIKQINQENKKWGAVDKEDAKHQQREAQKRQQDAQKHAKKKEKRDLLLEEEAKTEQNIKPTVKKYTR